MKHSMGFTIVEVFISLLVVALLLRFGAASFTDLLSTTRSNSALQTIHDSVALARSRAILERTSVTVCGSVDGVNCSRNWNQVVLVFADSNNDSDVDAEETLFATSTMPEVDGEILWRAFQNRRVLRINSVGSTHNQNGSFTYCHSSGDEHRTRQLVVSRTARLRFARDNDGDGIVDDSSGNPVSCP